jgi:hypothetical protein
MERFGKSTEMMMPIGQYEQWCKEREVFFPFVEEIGKTNKSVSPEKIERDVSAAKRAVRKAQ